MCGIVGILALAGDSIDRAVVERMNRSIFHRGPDSAGELLEPNRVALAMRRLAIIDVAGGAQPVGNEDGSIQVVFNGEIYNHARVRQELEGRGHTFRTNSDTEVIVHAYEEFGDDFPNHLDGMFGFALWDSNRERLLLARDRVGIKQLFYAERDGELIWGSELKALLQHPKIERRLRPTSVNHYLTFLYVPEPLTMFEGIDELEAGHMLIAERGRVTKHRYWRLDYPVDESMTEKQAEEGLRHHLDQAVRDRLISEVPLGAFLSGGIDSAAVVALMAQHSDEAVRTFSIGYETGGEEFDERAHAKRLAARYATQHVEFSMNPDLVDLLPKIVRAFDQPCADSTAIPTWYLCKKTREHVTVALSGLGGDEVAAGYERYRGAMLAERLQWIPRPLIRGLAVPFANALPDSKTGNQWPQRIKRFARSLSTPFDQRYFEFVAQHSRDVRRALLTPAMSEQIDLDEPRAIYENHLADVRQASPLNRALYADLRLYLPGDLLTLTDRISMAHSLEVRVPFLDHHLLEFAGRIPPRYKLNGMERKAVLKRCVADLLPEDFLKRRKMGFSAPVAVWFRNELRDFVEDTLAERELRAAGVFEPAAVRRILDDHFALRGNHDNSIWALMAFSHWHKTYIASEDGLVIRPPVQPQPRAAGVA